LQLPRRVPKQGRYFGADPGNADALLRKTGCIRPIEIQPMVGKLDRRYLTTPLRQFPGKLEHKSRLT